MSDPLSDAPAPTISPARGRGRRKSRRQRKANWGLRGAVALGGLLVLALLAYFAFGIWLRSYLRSAGFQNQLSDQLAATIKAESRFEDLTWTGNQVQLPKIISTGYVDAAFSKLVVDDLRADLKMDLWNRRVEVPTINISRVQIVASDEGRLPGPFVGTAEISDSAAVHSESWLDSLKPNQFRFGEIKIDDTSLLVKSAQGELKLTGLPLTIKSGGDLQSWSLSSHPQGERGQILTNLGQGMRVQVLDLNARVRPEQVDLLSFEGELTPLATPGGKRLSEVSKARLSANGSFQTGGKEATLDFHLTANDLELQDWVEETWVKRLSGKADLTVALSGSPSVPTAIQLKGNFGIKHGTLTSLPFLESLAERTKTAEFTRLELNTAKCDFAHQADSWHFTNIEIEARGLVRLQGSVTITGNVVSGVLEVGVAPGRLRAIDGAEQRVFVREEQGYKWATPPMHLSGTLEDLQEDLGARIENAWFDQQIENVTDLANKTPTEVIQGGTKMIQEGVKAAPDLINQGVNLFNSLLPKSR